MCRLFLSPAWPRRLRSQLFLTRRGLAPWHVLGTEAKMATRVIFGRLLCVVWSMYFPKSFRQVTRIQNLRTMPRTYSIGTSFRATSIGQSPGIRRVSYPSKRATQPIATYPAAASIMLFTPRTVILATMDYLHWTSFPKYAESESSKNSLLQYQKHLPTGVHILPT